MTTKCYGSGGMRQRRIVPSPLPVRPKLGLMQGGPLADKS
jgi:hypothetical protein